MNMFFSSIRAIQILLPRLKVIAKGLYAQQGVALQGLLRGGEEKVTAAVVCQSLQTAVFTGFLELRRHGQPSACTLSVKTILVNLVISLAADEECLRRGTVADALHISVGHSAGAVALVLNVDDAAFLVVDGYAEHVETVLRSLIVDHSEAAIADSADATIVTRRQFAVEALPHNLHIARLWPGYQGQKGKESGQDCLHSQHYAYKVTPFLRYQQIFANGREYFNKNRRHFWKIFVSLSANWLIP